MRPKAAYLWSPQKFMWPKVHVVKTLGSFFFRATRARFRGVRGPLRGASKFDQQVYIAKAPCLFWSPDCAVSRRRRVPATRCGRARSEEAAPLLREGRRGAQRSDSSAQGSRSSREGFKTASRREPILSIHPLSFRILSSGPFFVSYVGNRSGNHALKSHVSMWVVVFFFFDFRVGASGSSA